MSVVHLCEFSSAIAQSRLIDELSADPSAVQISEVPNEGHWWNGVVDDATMQAFFSARAIQSLPPLPSSFTVTTINPLSFGGRGSICNSLSLSLSVYSIQLNRHQNLTIGNPIQR
jgi:hypothetical protein